MCLAGTVVASQKVVDASPFNDKYRLTLNFLNSLNSVKTFRKNSIDIYNFEI